MQSIQAGEQKNPSWHAREGAPFFYLIPSQPLLLSLSPSPPKNTTSLLHPSQDACAALCDASPDCTSFTYCADAALGCDNALPGGPPTPERTCTLGAGTFKPAKGPLPPDAKLEGFSAAWDCSSMGKKAATGAGAATGAAVPPAAPKKPAAAAPDADDAPAAAAAAPPPLPARKPPAASAPPVDDAAVELPSKPAPKALPGSNTPSDGPPAPAPKRSVAPVLPVSAAGGGALAAGAAGATAAPVAAGGKNATRAGAVAVGADDAPRVNGS